ncbi:hypothetical protein HDV00_011326 [Rhizophlyctis rosea]|nr:hypothetical protein HDV00_011326 [Rhizophlyctis rosea]
MDEILSDRPPFLPGRSSESPHFLLPGPARYCDLQFRLLREDMISSLREGLKGFISALNHSGLNVASIVRGGKFAAKDSDAGDLHVYTNLRISGFKAVRVDRRHGVVLDVTFTPMAYGRRFATVKGRVDYWNRSKRLIFGSLVCMLVDRRRTARRRMSDDAEWSHDVIFAIVVGRSPEALGTSEESGTVTLKIIESRFLEGILSSLTSYSQGAANANFLLEGTSVFFEAYRPILETIKSINPHTLPFLSFLAPEDGTLPATIDLPFYARADGFAWDLTSLVPNGVPCSYRPQVIGSKERAMQVLRRYSTLDDGQCGALLDCLSRELALVQGPPGTGKTYLGVKLVRVLLSLQHKDQSMPILCICETNHALDQFLERLLDAGTDIVRIGKRSKSERVQKYELDVVCSNAPQLGAVRRQIYDKRQERDEFEKEMGMLRETYLAFEEVQEQLRSGYDEDGFMQANFNRKEKNVIKRWTLCEDLEEAEQLEQAWAAYRRQQQITNPYQILANDGYGYFEGSFYAGEGSYLPATPSVRLPHANLQSSA